MWDGMFRVIHESRISFPLSFEKWKQIPERPSLPSPPAPTCQTQLTAEPSELKLSGAFNTLAGSGNHVAQDISNLLQVGLGCVQVTKRQEQLDLLKRGLGSCPRSGISGLVSDLCGVTTLLIWGFAA